MDMVTFSMLLKTFMKHNILGLTRLCSATDLIHLVFFLWKFPECKLFKTDY